MQISKYIQWIEHNKKWMFAIMAAILIVSYTINFFFLETFIDHSYYINCSRLILEGKYPFTDFNPSYPPLVYYIGAVVLRIFPDTVYTHLMVLYAFIAADTFIIYKLAKKLNASSSVTTLTIFYFLFLMIKSDGTAYVLEPFVLFFGLLSLLVVQSRNKMMLFVAGMLAMCAAWCKQYGVGFVCLSCLYPIVESQSIGKKITKALIIIAGIAAGFFTLFGISQLNGAEYSDLSMLSGNSYQRHGFDSLLNGYFKFSGIAHIFVVFLFLIPYYFRTLIKKPMAWICVAGIIGFMMQCYVRNFRHYMILAIPFVVLLIPIVINCFKTQKAKTIFLSLVCVSLFAKSIELIVKDCNVVRQNGRAKEVAIAKELAETIPYGTDDVYVSIRALRSTAHNYYKPSLIQEHGMANGFADGTITTNEYLSTCQWLVIDDEDMKDSARFNGASFAILQSQYQLVKHLTGEGGNPALTVYKRNK